MTLTYAELCAGYGGLGLAIEEVMGAELKWYSEFEAAPSKIMAAHWPDAPNHGDMTQIDWAAVEPVDIISGGTPCQDLSHAGRRAGMTEGTRSNLWVQMREAIATIKPTYVVWENVRGAYSAGADSELEPCAGCMGSAGDGRTALRALGRVLGDLSDLGFDAEWRGLRAADVGAPHGRFRVFILAKRRYAFADGDGGRMRGWPTVPGNGGSSRSNLAADWPDDRPSESGATGATGSGLLPANDPRGSRGDEALERDGRCPTCGNRPSVPDESDRDALRVGSERIDWKQYTPAIRRWEAVRGAAPTPTELTPKGKHRLSARFAEWMMGVPSGWIADTPGISRNDQLKAAGNGVVPQQAAAALADMLRSFQ